MCEKNKIKRIMWFGFRWMKFRKINNIPWRHSAHHFGWTGLWFFMMKRWWIYLFFVWFDLRWFVLFVKNFGNNFVIWSIFKFFVYFYMTISDDFSDFFFYLIGECRMPKLVVSSFTYFIFFCFYFFILFFFFSQSPLTDQFMQIYKGKKKEIALS